MNAQTPPLRFFFSLSAAVLFLTANPASAQLVTNAYDNADNYPTNSAWTNGANGGFGFGAWTLVSTNGTLTNSYGGSFVGNPTNSGVVGMSTNSFGLYAKPNSSGSFANAERILTSPLLVGQTLRLQWGINFDSGSNGNKGFNLIAGGTEIVNVNNGASADITLNGTNVGFGYGTNVMTWSFTRTAANTITVVANDRDGSGTYSNNIPVANGAISSFKFYAFQMQAGDEAQPYFNNLEVFGPVPTTNNVTFSVDMNTQAAIGNFNPATDAVSVEWGAGFSLYAYLTDADGDGIYTGTASVSAPANTPVSYRYVNEPANISLPLVRETVSRSFTMPTSALVITPTPYFDNIEGYRDVTFSVNMTVQTTLGTFVPAQNVVEIRGPFNGWSSSAAWQLSDGDGDGIYTGTFRFGGTSGQAIEYKYFASGTLGYESGSNRSFNLAFNVGGSPTPAQALTTVYFSNQSSVTFSVDMSIQQSKGLFNPATGTVELRGLGSFGAADAKTLTRVGTTLVYTGSYAVGGDAGTTFNYKFYSSGVTASGYEVINPNDLLQNRAATLEASGTPQVLPLAYFSNELFYVTGTPLNAFSTTQGTASASQIVTVNGQGLTANIVATAPTGFEVSPDGSTYGISANLVPTSGTVTAALLYTRIAASAAAGSPAGNVVLASTGSQSVDVAVTGTVSAAANGYNTWLANYSLAGADTNGTADPDKDGFINNVEFAFDGDPTNGTPALMTVTPVGTNAAFRWVERNSSVTYQVQKNGNLTNTWSNATGLVISNSTNTNGVLLPSDYTRKEFIVPASGKDFYRVIATVPAQ